MGASDPKASRKRESATVLLVEDEPQVRSITAEILRASGFSVLEAADGVEARERSERTRGPIDLLLVDLLLPGMSGPEVAEMVHRQRPDTKIVFITGHSEDIVDRSRVASLGASVLAKPYRIEELTRRVKEALGSRPARGPSRRARTP
jgi:two-component system cell cycle sensor histidine kinase/response regulator CckA